MSVQASEKAGITLKTFYKWRKQFITTGKFEADRRGLVAFGWLLVNEDKKHMLDQWLKSQKEIDPDVTRDWINAVLLKEFPIGRIPKYGRLKRPIDPTTSLRWMKVCFCVQCINYPHINVTMCVHATTGLRLHM